MSVRSWAVSFAAILSLGFLFFWPASPERRANSGLPSPARTIASVPEFPSYAPVAGTRYAYLFDRSIEIEGLAHAPKSWNFTGSLWADVVETGTDSFIMEFSYKISRSPLMDSPKFRARISTRGNLISLYEPSGSDQDEERIQSQAILRDLVAQWVFLGDTDTTGDYRSEIQADSQNDSYKKIKLEYIRSSPARPEILHSQHRLLWNRAIGLPSQIEGSEQTKLSSGQFSLVSQSKYLIAFQGVQKIPQQAQAKDWSKISTLAVTQIASERSLFPLSVNWSELATSLDQLDRFDSNERMAWFGKLIRLIQLKPETLDEITKTLASMSSSTIAFRTLIGALASAGTPQAQKALIDTFQSAQADQTAKHLILNALNTTQARLEGPTRDFLANVFQTEKDTGLSKSAGYALGSSLKGVKDPNAVSLIRQSWESSKTDRERAFVLDVAGNSAAKDFLPQIEEAIHSSNPMLRSKAVFALRGIDGDLANQLLEKSYSDPSAAVRASAIKAIRYKDRNDTILALLRSCSEKDPSQAIRTRCSEELAK